MMDYKGYTGRITAVDARQGLLHGEVADLHDVVTFQGKTAAALVQAFQDSVDDYLAFCAERAEKAQKPCSGKFLVRTSPLLHQQATLAALKEGVSLNAWVSTAIEAHLGRSRARRTRTRPRAS
jgi:predicted HicB family RNase H-like nuclease